MNLAIGLSVLAIILFAVTLLHVQMLRVHAKREAGDGVREPQHHENISLESSASTKQEESPLGRDDQVVDLSFALVDAFEAEVCLLDSSGRILRTNGAWDDRLSRACVSRSGEKGADFFAFCRYGGYYDPASCEELVRAIEGVLTRDRQSFHGEFFVDDEHRRCEVEVRVQPLGDGSGSVLVVQHDRSVERERERRLEESRRKAETLADALETSQHSLKFAMRGANLGLWHWDVNTGYFELTRDWVAALGHARADLGADINSFRELLHEDDLVLWTEEDANSICGDEPFDRQFRLRRSDGSYLWAQALGRADTFREDGSPETLSGVLIDIDARKCGELRDAGMAKIIEESLNEIYVFDADSLEFLEANRGARENLDYSREEIQAMFAWDIKPEFSEEEFRKHVAPLLANETSRLEYETLHQRRDGSTYPVMVQMQTAVLVGRPVLVAILLDLTQRSALETQLRQAQKLESVGQLAAGVAHEINTPMQYVRNNTHFLSNCSSQLFEVIEAYETALGDAESADRDGVDEVIRRTRFDRIRSELPRAIEECTEGIDRVLKIVRAMKELTHPGGSDVSTADINHLLQSAGTITQNRWKYVAELVYDLDPGLPSVVCDGGALSQVFVNLIVNASDAIVDKTGGSGSMGEIVVRSRTESDAVVVEVCDSGCGMSEEVRRRCFDPFYTTKEVGRGTGQGLALCHTFVTKKHAGEIAVESVEGGGTTIRVRLPTAVESGGIVGCESGSAMVAALPPSESELDAATIP